MKRDQEVVILIWMMMILKKVKIFLFQISQLVVCLPSSSCMAHNNCRKFSLPDSYVHLNSVGCALSSDRYLLIY